MPNFKKDRSKFTMKGFSPFNSGTPYATAYDTDNDKLLFTYRDNGGHYDLSSVTTSGISSFTVNATNMMVNIGSENPFLFLL